MSVDPPRIIPCLLIADGRLVKTVRFKEPKYIGDPLNAVRILNEKQVDELVFLDIEASKQGREPDWDLIRAIAAECFMPFAYGGGVKTLEQVRRVLTDGAEKVVINTAAFDAPDLITQAAREFGAQSVVAAVDVKRGMIGGKKVYRHARGQGSSLDPLAHCKRLVDLGAGEIFLSDVDSEGVREGYDLDLIGAIARELSVPLVACGGAASLEDLRKAIDAGASAAAAGSLFTLYGKHRAVLVTYPSREDLDALF